MKSVNCYEDPDNKRNEWDNSYENCDNFVFYPHEEVIRFVSKYIRKRTGIKDYKNITQDSDKKRVLDLGCGIGRHVIFCHEMGLEAYGIDLSDAAIQIALKWAERSVFPKSETRIYQGDIRQLPWVDGFFHYAVSHGVLDSMSFKIAREACFELARVMSKDGLFYCDLISGDDSHHAREFTGEEVVNTMHERGTIQLYYNFSTIQAMIENLFKIEECNLIRRENILQGGYTSRYHLILKKI